MSSFKAELIIEGKTYALDHCSFNYQQCLRTDGKPQTKVKGGSINLVLQDPAPREIIEWIMAPSDKKQGAVRFYEVNAMTGTHQLLQFGDAFCTQFGNSYNGESHNAGRLVSAFTLSAQLLSFDGIDLNQ